MRTTSAEPFSSQTLANIPHLSADKAQSLKQVATESTGSNRGPVAEELIRQKARAIRRQQAESRDLVKLLEKAWNALPQGPHHRLTTIPGIGLQPAAALVAKIVCVLPAGVRILSGAALKRAG